MSRSPTARTLERLRQLGHRPAVVERWFHGKRYDVFGFIDIVALACDGSAIIGIQATSGANKVARIKKITGECRDDAAHWLHCGGRIQVWTWYRYKQKIDGDNREWRETVTEVGLEDLT